ncbi:hypothetical protein RhiirB3_492501 [Rhizophagus irregularis]|nr:hypothetical protein RhiirB3_492501 [Rhizophagus irregularis]
MKETELLVVSRTFINSLFLFFLMRFFWSLWSLDLDLDGQFFVIFGNVGCFGRRATYSSGSLGVWVVVRLFGSFLVDFFNLLNEEKEFLIGVRKNLNGVVYNQPEGKTFSRLIGKNTNPSRKSKLVRKKRIRPN